MYAIALVVLFVGMTWVASTNTIIDTLLISAWVVGYGALLALSKRVAHGMKKMTVNR